MRVMCVCAHTCERDCAPTCGYIRRRKETYGSNVHGLKSELIHPGTFKIVLQVVVGDQKDLLDGVRFIPVELDVDPGVCAGPRDIPCLQADVIAEV